MCLPELRPQTVSLSATNGTLTVASGTPATSLMVALDTDVTVNTTGVATISATAPSGQTAVQGMVVGDASALEVMRAGIATGVPTITGAIALGEDWVADTTAISDPDGPQILTFSYQWQRSTDADFTDPTDISGATRATYRLTRDDFGKYLRIVASFTDATSNIETTASAPVAITESDLCERTLQVRDAIVALVSGVDDCAAVTTAQLNALSGPLNLRNTGLTALESGDFAGLTKLKTLWLDGNGLSSLPEDVFADLASLAILELDDNIITSLPDGVFDGLSWLEHLEVGQQRPCLVA